MEMSKDDFGHLVSSIASGKCVLFAGSGLTVDGGGTTWAKLARELIDHFKHEGPLDPEVEPFEVMSDLCQKFGEDKVHGFIADRLKDVIIPKKLEPLLTLPWYSAFTTNYDEALEKGLQTAQPDRLIQLVVTGKEFQLRESDYHLPVVKLMGTLNVPFGRPGAMVVDGADLAMARDEREDVFTELAKQALHLTFFFVGYSFKDQVFFEVLERLRKAVGVPTGPAYFAILYKEPTRKEAYNLDRFGVRYRVADAGEFSATLKAQQVLQNRLDYTRTKVLLGKDVVGADAKSTDAFVSNYRLVTFADMQEPMSGEEFLRGSREGLHPFTQAWHFRRPEEEQLLTRIVQPDDNGLAKVIAISGMPGAGRTFMLRAAAARLVTENRALVVRLNPNAISPVPRAESLQRLIDAIRSAAIGADVKGPSLVALVAEFTPDPGHISQFIRLAERVDLPVRLLVETIPQSPLIEDFPQELVERFQLRETLLQSQRAELTSYLLKTIKSHRLPERSQEEVEEVLDEENEFFAVMYRIMNPSKFAINKIVADEFKQLTPEATEAVAFVTIPTTLGMSVPIDILRRVIEARLHRTVAVWDVGGLLDVAPNFLKEDLVQGMESRIVVYHPLIAAQVGREIGHDEMDQYLLLCAELLDPHKRQDAEFARQLFTSRSARERSGVDKPFSETGLLRALARLKERHPARPVLHHLALLYRGKDTSHPDIVPLLRQALASTRDEYPHLDEPRENIQTTLAKTLWIQRKAYLLNAPRTDAGFAEIVELLTEAEMHTNSPHPFDTHARCLLEMAERREGEEQLELVEEGLGVVNRGLQRIRDGFDEQVKLDHIREGLLRLVPRRRLEADAESMLTRKNDGTGFAALAHVIYAQDKNAESAMAALRRALSAKSVPITAHALALQIELDRKDKKPNYQSVLASALEVFRSRHYERDWQASYNAAVVLFTNGRTIDSVKCFRAADRWRHYRFERPISAFWEGETRRRVFTGRIGSGMTTREGQLYGHDVPNWQEDVIFNVLAQPRREELRPGLLVNFELGFSTRGPQAFDVRPVEGRFNRP